jgi:short-subunit dehydrogenase
MKYLFKGILPCLSFRANLHRKRIIWSALLLVWSLMYTSCRGGKLPASDQKQLKNKVVLITGASSGFGKGTALRLGSYGATVVICARNEVLIQEVADSVRKLGGKAIAMALDVSDLKAFARLRDTALSVYGRIDIWINNAGIASIGAFTDVPLEEHIRVDQVNYLGVLYGSYMASELFQKQKYGTLINLGSVESEIPVAYQTSYSASKAAVRSLTEAIRQEFRLSGLKEVRVVTIMPWASNTPLWYHLGNHSGGTVSMFAMDKPERIINAIVYSCMRGKGDYPVGWKAKIAVQGHRMLPRLTRRWSSGIIRKYQYKAPPLRPPSSGNLFESEHEFSEIEMEPPKHE